MTFRPATPTSITSVRGGGSREGPVFLGFRKCRGNEVTGLTSHYVGEVVSTEKKREGKGTTIFFVCLLLAKRTVKQ